METLRILWYNWRCIKNPLAGGAEIYTHEIARRLAKQGHEIILATSRTNELSRKEIIDGYLVLRYGERFTIYLKAKKVYNMVKNNYWKPDIVIDEVNTIPFFTPLYSQEPIIMIIHQLCKDCWRYSFNKLVEPIGWAFEKLYHRMYIHASKKGKIKYIVTVSPSTRDDLINLGYSEDIIRIIYNGLNWDFYNDCIKYSKIKEDAVAYVGRITRYKNIDLLLRAWYFVEKEEKGVKLIIAGRPDPKYLKQLVRLSEKLGLKKVVFKINISDHEKKRILARSKLLVYPSIREGWGQTVLEAAACMTPTIACYAPGLKDAIQDMKTGILVKTRKAETLANSILYLLQNEEKRKYLGRNAYEYAKQFSWEKTASEFLSLIKNF